MSEKRIVIQGKEIDYGAMDNDTLLKLYTELLQRQAKLQEKAAGIISANRMAEIDINNIEL